MKAAETTNARDTSGANERPVPRDPIIDEQASLKEADDRAPVAAMDRPGPGAREAGRPWREPVQQVPEEEPGKEWAGGEATGMSGGGMPEAAGQTENPGTDTDINLPRAKPRINLDRA